MRWLSGVSCAPPAFRGQQKQVQRWVAEHRTAPAPSTPHQWRTKTPAHAPRPAPQDGAPALPSPPQLAWLLVQPPSALSGPDHDALEQRPSGGADHSAQADQAADVWRASFDLLRRRVLLAA